MDRLDVNDLRKGILYSAAYADIFDYAQSAAEIQRYLVGVKASLEEVEAALASEGLLSRRGACFTLPGRERLAELRLRREAQSARLWPFAARFGRLIARMPFVRMLAVTGSLAVNNVVPGADVDYLIVSAPGRLWTARAGALAVARFAALWKVKLCPNYLVSERALAFPDPSLYTAHELAQMVPLSGLEVYERVLGLNRWMEEYLPNARSLPPAARRVKAASGRGRAQAALERLVPAGFEEWERTRKIQRLRLEQGASAESAFSAEICKGHDRQHARLTGERFRERLETLVAQEAG